MIFLTTLAMSKIKKIPKGINNMNYDNKGSID